MDIIKVVCGIIFQNNRVLICKRRSEKSLGGFWEFPGGKVEENESFEDCLTRELAEELGLEVSIDSLFMNNMHHYEKTTIELISFKCSTKQSEMNLIDHDQVEWVFPATLLDWKLAPADVPIAKALIKEL